MSTPLRLPADDTLSYLLLTLTAISGEFPTSQVARLPGGASYKENLLTQMRRTKLLLIIPPALAALLYAGGYRSF